MARCNKMGAEPAHAEAVSGQSPDCEERAATAFRGEVETDPHTGKVVARVRRDPGGEPVADSGAIFGSAREAADRFA